MKTSSRNIATGSKCPADFLLSRLACGGYLGLHFGGSVGSNPPISMPMTEDARRRLQEARRQLLSLHKILLDQEKVSYEKLNGPIAGPAQLLNLLMNDPFFDWLHRISEIIVQMDELLENEEATLENASDMMAHARNLIRATGEETEFLRRYRQVLQKDSAAVLAHAQVQKALLPEG